VPSKRRRRPRPTLSKKGERIVVTATKRETPLQDVPFSINAQTEEDIRRSGAVTLEDLSRNVAGLAIQNLGPGQSQVSIAAFSSGQIVRDQPGVKEQVGVYLDETAISMSLFTPDLDLFDLNRVETLRGPQGTLYGSGNIGGTLRYITNEARLGVSEGAVELNANKISGGSAGGGVKGALNVPMGDAAAMRLVGYATHFGGWADALGPGGAKDVKRRRPHGRPPELHLPPQPGPDDLAAGGLPEVHLRRVQPRGEVQPLCQPLHDHRAAGHVRGQPAIPAAAREVRGQDDDRRPDGQGRLPRFRPHLGDHVYRSRRPGKPRRQRADRFGVGRSRLSDRRRAAALAPQRHHRLQGLHAGIALELHRQGPAAMAGRRLLCRQRPQVCAAPSDPGLRHR
jgi:outer membrane receptor protein involved in Fe transport